VLRPIDPEIGRLSFYDAINKSKQKWLPLRGAYRRADKEKVNKPDAIL